MTDVVLPRRAAPRRSRSLSLHYSAIEYGLRVDDRLCCVVTGGQAVTVRRRRASSSPPLVKNVRREYIRK